MYTITSGQTPSGARCKIIWFKRETGNWHGYYAAAVRDNKEKNKIAGYKPLTIYGITTEIPSL